MTRAEAAGLTAIAQGGSPTSAPFTLAALTWHAHTLAGVAFCDLGEAHLARKATRGHVRRGRVARFAKTAARHPVATGRTCVRAAKLLPTVKQAVPLYVWPILALAALVKCLPLDCGTDEALFTIAALLILWKRPGLLEALYREAAAGKPQRCQCTKHARA